MTKDSTKTVNVLLLGKPLLGPDFERWLVSHAKVQRADSLGVGLQSLRGESFDAVITGSQYLDEWPRTLLCETAATFFDEVDFGVAMVSRTGQMIWSNSTLSGYAKDLQEYIRRCCREMCDLADDEAARTPQPVENRPFRFSGQDDQEYDITITPVLDGQQQIRWMTVAVGRTESTKAIQDKIDAIDRAGYELLHLNDEKLSKLNVHDRLELLEEKVDRCVKELLHFDNFEIRTLNRKTQKLELALSFGVPADRYLRDLAASKESGGICGYVAANGRSYICPDTSQDPRYIPCIEGARSSLTVPLTFHDVVVGVGNFESNRLAAFNEHDRQLAEILGRYIALALHILELLATERQTTTGEIGTHLLSGITAPLNDILTEVENLVEDYIGHDDLRHRLRKLSENVAMIRDSVRAVSASDPTVVGALATTTVREDPVLSGKRVLVADDEDIIRETVRDVLAGYGCDVRAAPDGDAAIALITEYPFDLVLTDIRMPRKNGYEVFFAAKQANPQTPVILTTGFGYDPNHAIVRARREGLAAVLFKPFKVDQLLEEVRSALQPVTKS